MFQVKVELHRNSAHQFQLTFGVNISFLQIESYRLVKWICVSYTFQVGNKFIYGYCCLSHSKRFEDLKHSSCVDGSDGDVYEGSFYVRDTDYFTFWRRHFDY